MADFGVIEEVKLQQGFTFVRYKTHEQAAKAIIGMSGKTIGGKTVKVLKLLF